MAVDEAGLNEFLGRFVSDLGATGTAGNVVIGHRLGLYRALAHRTGHAGGACRAGGLPPALPHGVAARPGRYAMTEEQIFALADPEGRSTHPGLCHGRRVHPLPARGGDPVQPGLRGPIVGPYPYPYLRHVIPQGMS
jgi:hypothetical protein